MKLHTFHAHQCSFGGKKKSFHSENLSSRTDVLVSFALSDELCEAALHDAGRPFVHMTLVVVVTPYDALNTLKHTQRCGSTSLNLFKHCQDHTHTHTFLFMPL